MPVLGCSEIAYLHTHPQVSKIWLLWTSIPTYIHTYIHPKSDQELLNLRPFRGWFPPLANEWHTYIHWEVYAWLLYIAYIHLRVCIHTLCTHAWALMYTYTYVHITYTHINQECPLTSTSYFQKYTHTYTQTDEKIRPGYILAILVPFPGAFPLSMFWFWLWSCAMAEAASLPLLL